MGRKNGVRGRTRACLPVQYTKRMLLFCFSRNCCSMLSNASNPPRSLGKGLFAFSFWGLRSGSDFPMFSPPPSSTTHGFPVNTVPILLLHPFPLRIFGRSIWINCLSVSPLLLLPREIPRGHFCRNGRGEGRRRRGKKYGQGVKESIFLVSGRGIRPSFFCQETLTENFLRVPHCRKSSNASAPCSRYIHSLQF